MTRRSTRNRAARGTIHAADGKVSVHVRHLRVDGPPALAAAVFVANNQTGNYSVHFRQAAWAEIADALADAASRYWKEPEL